MPSQVEPLATPPGVASPLVYPSLPIRAGTPRCHTAQLEVGFITGFAAAGSIQDTFEVRNVSATGCWVYGYVGFQTLDRDGRPVPQSINWSTHSYFGDSAPPSRILLPSGTTPLGVSRGPVMRSSTCSRMMCCATPIRVPSQALRSGLRTSSNR